MRIFPCSLTSLTVKSVDCINWKQCKEMNNDKWNSIVGLTMPLHNCILFKCCWAAILVLQIALLGSTVGALCLLPLNPSLVCGVYRYSNSRPYIANPYLAQVSHAWVSNPAWSNFFRKRTLMRNFWTESERDILNFYKNIVRGRFHGWSRPAFRNRTPQ